ncbi:rab-GTPase-TBC domain-containing protein [Lipomyces oligophaga]|uniref:rab-GTPase-TBC domain-containing protein n=1 Tax=Lipomyces oligophaga TaxID=45792 RepID=UPI0034CE06D9
MSSKKFTGQEMVQLDGRSTPAAAFLKSAVRFHSQNQGYRPLTFDDDKTFGSGYSHADILRASSKPKRTDNDSSPHRARTERRATYTDLDDDWDASFDSDVLKLSSKAMSSGSSSTSPPQSYSSSGLTPISSASSAPTLSPSLAAVDRSISPPTDLYSTSRRHSTSNNGMIRPNFEKIIQDPANALHMIAHAEISSNASLADIETINSRITRINKFKRILQASNVDIPSLRNLAWSGIPEELRPMSWQLMLGYLPTNADRRMQTLARKRKEYNDGVRQAFGPSGIVTDIQKSTVVDHAVWHQISIDVPRTNPHLKLYSFPATQRALERILYLWAIRHPASGYVQGINDLVTPFFQVFLSAYVDADVETYDSGQLPKEILDVIEADTFWCLTKLLDGIQDNYISAQPGIQRQVAALQDLTQRIDANLVRHLQQENVEFIQFSFRWMNCLLMREVSVKNTIRMWDTYMAEGSTGFSEFHLYVCAAFLVKWSMQIQTMDFQEIMMFLQSLPTQNWTEKDIELLLSEAYMWQSLFKNASAHLRSTVSTGVHDY